MASTSMKPGRLRESFLAFSFAFQEIRRLGPGVLGLDDGLSSISAFQGSAKLNDQVA